MKTSLPYAFKSSLVMTLVLVGLAGADAAYAQDDVVVIDSGSVHTLRLDGSGAPGVQILAAHDVTAVHTVAAAEVSAVDAAEAGVDGTASDVAAPAQARAIAKCGDGSRVYSRHGTLCAEHGGITRLYQ